jgi:uncharacterized membrane protein YfcA
MPPGAGWLALGLGALVGSTIGGVAGFGAGVVMLPVIAWTLGAKSTVPVLTVAMLVGNGARVWFSRHDIHGRVVTAFLIGAIPSTVAGAMLYTRIEGEWISRILGTFMLLMVPLRRWLSGRGVRIRLRHFPVIGAVFGVLSSLVGSVGAMMTPFFLGHGLRKGAFIGTEALCTVGSYIARVLVFRKYDLLTGPTVGAGLYIGLVMVLGAWTGRRLIERMSERVFLRVIEGLLVVFGLQFLLWPAG